MQIWDAPFDMACPRVAREVGNRLGAVEKVERRQRQDQQNLFMRVKVAIPISKPLRRGGYLVGSDGEKVWTTFKYERLPMFCHHYGLDREADSSDQRSKSEKIQEDVFFSKAARVQDHPCRAQRGC